MSATDVNGANGVRAVAVVPWLPGCPHRERAWRRVQSELSIPASEAHGATPWVKALAVMPEIRRLRCEIVAVHDADVLCESGALAGALFAVAAGHARWAIPHDRVLRLTEEGTRMMLLGEEGWAERSEEPPYAPVEGGGIVVVRREDALRVPLDPRFVGWGQEDDCWGVALTATLGQPWRGQATLLHLWHPPQARLNRRRGSIESWKLRRRYYEARYDGKMQTLLEEANDELDAALEPALHDRAAAGVG